MKMPFQHWLLQRLMQSVQHDPAKLKDAALDYAKALRATRFLKAAPDHYAIAREQLSAYSVMCIGMNRRPPKVEALT